MDYSHSQMRKSIMAYIHAFFCSTSRAVAFSRVFGSLRKRGRLAAMPGVLALMMGGTCAGVHAQTAHFTGAQSVVASAASGGLDNPYGVAVDGRSEEHTS